MRLRSLLVPAVALVLLASLGAPPVRADWVPVGPEGGSILALAVDPSSPAVVYAGTDGGGVWKSFDAGASWVWASLGVGNRQVPALAIDPANPDTLYAGTQVGAYKSVDGGVTWTAASEGLTDPQVVQVAIDPLHPATVYAGTFSGLFKSVDGAATWKAVRAPFPSAGILLLDPQSSGTLYIGAENAAGLFKTTDGGATWRDESADLGSASATVTALALDPAVPGKVYAAVRPLGSGPSAFFTSANGGASWVRAGRGLEGRVVETLAATPRSTALYAGTDSGTFRSTDGGRNWQRFGPAGAIVSLALAPGAGRSPGAVYAGALDLGVWKSADGGRSFKAANRGLLAAQVQDLTLSPGAPSTLYVRSTLGQIWRSADGGASFAAKTALPSVVAQGLAADPVHPAIVYAGLQGRIYKSLKSGDAWQPQGDNGDLSNVVTRVVVVDPAIPSIVYAGGGPVELRDLRCAGFKSTDSGVSWTCMPGVGPVVQDLAIAPSSPATIYAATGTLGMRKSVDRGTTWTSINRGLDGVTVLGLAVDPKTPSIVYATAQSAVYKTTDGGDSWTNVSAGLPVAPGKQIVFFNSVAVDPGDPRIVYTVAAIYTTRFDPPRLRVFKSTDGAATWSIASDGLPRVTNSSALVVDPRHPGTVYLGTYGRGVYQIQP
ncbi:MAG TPA: hypothetical protein VGR07_20150 [Thermoanaerobaculia bacterium]|jgi:photosystem II stability/assembly factor-like uncharacterized protein|nr:hypothetical protein [Thermoanaerobaculia bacterium]